jgi:hypothetical protein
LRTLRPFNRLRTGFAVNFLAHCTRNQLESP